MFSRKENGVLVEGEDYYEENGCTVFTSKYLLERGACCESGCRHCPYSLPEGKNRLDSEISRDE